MILNNGWVCCATCAHWTGQRHVLVENHAISFVSGDARCQGGKYDNQLRRANNVCLAWQPALILETILHRRRLYLDFQEKSRLSLRKTGKVSA